VRQNRGRYSRKEKPSPPEGESVTYAHCERLTNPHELNIRPFPPLATKLFSQPRTSVKQATEQYKTCATTLMLAKWDANARIGHKLLPLQRFAHELRRSRPSGGASGQNVEKVHHPILMMRLSGLPQSPNAAAFGRVAKRIGKMRCKSDLPC
jgi:hypothetical protein